MCMCTRNMLCDRVHKGNLTVHKKEQINKLIQYTDTLITICKQHFLDLQQKAQHLNICKPEIALFQYNLT